MAGLHHIALIDNVANERNASSHVQTMIILQSSSEVDLIAILQSRFHPIIYIREDKNIHMYYLMITFNLDVAEKLFM